MLSIRADRKIDVKVEPLANVDATVFFGAEDSMLPPIEVLVLQFNRAPSSPELRDVFRWRKNNQTRSVVVAIEAHGIVHMFGPSEDRQSVSVETSTASRILQSAINETSPLSARKHLIDFYDNLGNSEMSGIKNKGLFASHHLRENLPQRKDWKELQSKGVELATKRHRALIEALGFTVAGEERNTLILKASGPENRVIAVLLDDAETFDSPSGRFPSSPVAWGLSVAADHNVPWLIVLKKDQIRLHPGRDGVGVGQKGQAETFLELNLAQIDDEHLALLPLIFSAHSLEREGDVQIILDESSKYAVVLGARLRERVYESVVPNISVAVAKKLQKQGLTLDSDGLQKAYSVTLRILFRLLFQAYAEDRGLLPAGRNEGYDANSLKSVAKRDIDAKPEDFGDVVGLWYDLVQVWEAIDEGNPRWQVPAYNGGLFGRDPELHPEGALIKGLDLPDSVMGPALQALLIDETEDDVKGPVDFRSLSVREFGTIYEGLLESSLSLAEVDLTFDAKDAWVPAQPGDTVMAKAGEPYFHSASGERKATGSYFTPKFVVDHLVGRAIDPTIDKHLEKIKGYLEAGNQATANREFFDFRVADLAMGSAHFLVAAVDRIEAKMRAFLSNPGNTVPGVVDEISRLRKAATEALRGDEIAIAEIEDPSLLRRQIARRCIYGIDINPMAVELARLAIWIHTFVPGLPMSTLNHNLVCANSLTGIGSIDEALDALIPNRKNQPTFFDDAIVSGLEKAKILLIDAANASEADKAEAAAGARLAAEAKTESLTSKAIFDAAVAARMGLIDAASLFVEEEIVAAGLSPAAQLAASQLNPAHMPYLFPEVFLRKNPGFDALLGNPPWEKVHVDEQRWWGMYIPGLRALKPKQKHAKMKEFQDARPDLQELFDQEVKRTKDLNKALSVGNYPGIGSAHLDLFTLFAWRNYQLLRQEGISSIVLPRNSLVGSGLSQWRKTILGEATFKDVCVLSNSGHWVFDSVDTRYTIALVVVEKALGDVARIAGPFYGKSELDNWPELTATIDSEKLLNWSENASFPLVRNDTDAKILAKMLDAGNFKTFHDNFGFRPYAELNAASDSDKFSFDIPEVGEYVPIYGGASFNLWEPYAGEPFAYGLLPDFRVEMTRRFERAQSSPRSAYFQARKSISQLPYDEPRIAYRQITNQTNSRTTIVCLVPGNTATVHSAPTMVQIRGGAREEALLLGIMSSIPFDWAVRRWVELNLTIELLMQMPLPMGSLQGPWANELAITAAKLAARGQAFEKWATEVGIALTDAADPSHESEFTPKIDALVSLMFGLSREEVSHVFETFHRGWDYEARLKKVLEYYDQWKERA